MSVRTPSRERAPRRSAERTGRGAAPAVPAPREAAVGVATAEPGVRARGAGRTRTGQPRSAQARTTQARSTQTQAARTAPERAYARRDERLRRLVGAARPERSAVSTGRAKFVLVVMVLLTGGLVATLWLSTAAAADSYQLQDARADAATLSQRSEQLRREVASLASAPELARRAEALGMVRVEDPARLVVGPDGAVEVVGEPEAATPPAPVLPPAPPTPQTTPPAPTEESGTGAPESGAPGADEPDETGAAAQGADGVEDGNEDGNGAVDGAADGAPAAGTD
jgi:hypothetical protein